MMVRALKPIKEKRDYRVLCASLLLSSIRAVSIILLFVSAGVIIINYLDLVLGLQPSVIGVEQMNYSIDIFVGCGLFLITYSYEAERIIKNLFRVRDVPPIKT